eukprot:798917-Ditylum_brightwellii.AAC.1
MKDRVLPLLLLLLRETRSGSRRTFHKRKMAVTWRIWMVPLEILPLTRFAGGTWPMGKYLGCIKGK